MDWLEVLSPNPRHACITISSMLLSSFILASAHAQKRGLITKKVKPSGGDSASAQRTKLRAQPKQPSLQGMSPQARASAAPPQYFDAASQQPFTLQPPPGPAWAPQPVLGHPASMPLQAQQWRTPTQQPTPQQAQWQPHAQPSAAAMANLGVMPARSTTEMKPTPRPPATAQRPAGRPPAGSKLALQGPPPLDLIGHLQRQCAPPSPAAIP